jgi:hypothetical protein
MGPADAVEKAEVPDESASACFDSGEDVSKRKTCNMRREIYD